MTKLPPSNQKTIAHSISARGIGNHTGQEVTITLYPAPVNHGIVFQRVDLDGRPTIPATYDKVADTQLSTVIADEQGNTVGTIEHVMAALAANGIDNTIVAVNGSEIPMMDGSAAPFDLMIRMAQPKNQSVRRKYLKIQQDVSVNIGDASAHLRPAETTKICCDVDFDHPVIGQQSYSSDHSSDHFRHHIARARSFGFLHQAKMLWDNGLARGSDLTNIIVIGDPDLITDKDAHQLSMSDIRKRITNLADDAITPDPAKDRVLNAGGLRYGDEFARHKVLDAMGDLALAGMPIIGHYHGIQTGHEVTNTLLHKLFSDPNNFDVVIDYPTRSDAKSRNLSTRRRGPFNQPSDQPIAAQIAAV